MKGEYELIFTGPRDLNEILKKYNPLAYDTFYQGEERTAFPLRKREIYIIGRDQGCDIVVPPHIKYVSRTHAEINTYGVFIEDPRGGLAGSWKASIRDLGSMNGTYVRNQDTNWQWKKLGEDTQAAPIEIRRKLNEGVKYIDPPTEIALGKLQISFIFEESNERTAIQ